MVLLAAVAAPVHLGRDSRQTVAAGESFGARLLVVLDAEVDALLLAGVGDAEAVGLVDAEVADLHMEQRGRVSHCVGSRARGVMLGGQQKENTHKLAALSAGLGASVEELRGAAVLGEGGTAGEAAAGKDDG